jgi:hypothetical protein
MDIDDPAWLLLDDFFRAEAHGRAEPTARRYLRVRARLLAFLETADMAAWLGTHEAAVLDAERQFHDHGAFWHLFGADALVCCLPGFVEPEWLAPTVGEARTQISLVSRLLDHLARGGHLDLPVVQCALWDAGAAVVAARRRLAERSARSEPDPWATDIPDRLRRRPGPQW